MNKLTYLLNNGYYKKNLSDSKSYKDAIKSHFGNKLPYSKKRVSNNFRFFANNKGLFDNLGFDTLWHFIIEKKRKK